MSQREGDSSTSSVRGRSFATLVVHGAPLRQKSKATKVEHLRQEAQAKDFTGDFYVPKAGMRDDEPGAFLFG